jgi:hypothetical protein
MSIYSLIKEVMVFTLVAFWGSMETVPFSFMDVLLLPGVTRVLVSRRPWSGELDQMWTVNNTQFFL